MKKSTLAVLLTLIAVFGGLMLNFGASGWGGTNGWNLLVTLCCVILWGFALYLATKDKSRKVLMYCFVFWAVAVFLSAAGLYVVSNNFLHNPITVVLAPLQVLTYGQFTGIGYFYGNNLPLMHATVLLISAATAIVSMTLYRRVRRG